MQSGTYTLLIRLPTPTTIAVSALGPTEFTEGWYAYTGSASQPSGFARVERHRAVSRGDHTVRHWHIDYFLGTPETTIAAVLKAPSDTAECRINTRIPGTPITGFEASDCSCTAHLVYDDDRTRLETRARAVHAAVGTVH